MSCRIVIAGGRDFEDRAFLFHCMRGVYHTHSHKAMIVVSGACAGADTLGEEWAEQFKIPVESKPPDYNKFKGREKYAPLARNEEMAAVSQVLCAFWDGQSRGTRHMIQCAVRNGLEIHIFRYGDKPTTGDLFNES